MIEAVSAVNTGVEVGLANADVEMLNLNHELIVDYYSDQTASGMLGLGGSAYL